MTFYGILAFLRSPFFYHGAAMLFSITVSSMAKKVIRRFVKTFTKSKMERRSHDKVDKDLWGEKSSGEWTL
ncbi:hypothetical protein [Sutcliffiella horikoshii]|uniref:hypothetical protein n=1 Tax=Sutcliffiella horikoshii TaxID=79883 RepID=UPI001CFE3BDA|nr:hypothetical protein [Sutcliffiella horikoshii]